MSFDLFGALSPTTSEPDTSVSDASENHKKTDGDDNDEEPRSSGPRQVSQVEVEGSTPQYEGTFDDYLEMFIQFGYVTLFSSAYPLAGLCALFNNLIEVRSDAFKLCFIHQRPFPERVQVIRRTNLIQFYQVYILEYWMLANSDGDNGSDWSHCQLCSHWSVRSCSPDVS